MKSPEAFRGKKTARGFTLVELLLVIALTFIVGVFMFPMGISFYRTQMLNETAEGMQSALRRAQTFALSGKQDSVFGVKLLDSSYILFRGDTYAERSASDDEVYAFPTAVEVAGFDEITFEQITGNPSITALITLTSEFKEEAIEITGSGIIQ